MVQARKRAESLQNIPVSGSVISEQEIGDIGGLTGDFQLADFFLGVEANDGIGNEYFIRGAGSGRSDITASATTQLRNGAEIAGGYNGRAFQRIDNFDTQQVEVYRGAQGSLYGRNAVGGVMAINNQQPKEVFEYSALTSYAFNSEEVRAEGIVNVPLIQNRLFARVGTYYEAEEGFLNNPFLDDPMRDTENWGGRVALKALLGERVDATLFVDYGEDEYESFVQSFSITATSPGAGYPAAGVGGSLVDEEGNVITAPLPYPALAGSRADPYEVARDTPGYLTSNTFNVNLRVNADVGIGTLSSITNYRNRITDVESDADHGVYFPALMQGTLTFAAPGTRCATSNEVTTMCVDTTLADVTILTQEFRLVPTTPGRLTWLLGTDVRLLKNSFLDTMVGRLPTPAETVSMISYNFEEDVEQVELSAGVFGSAGYDVTDRFNLAGSVRVNWERESLDTVQTDLGGTNTLGLPHGPFGEVRRVDDSVQFFNVSPSVTATYELTNDLLVFASWSQGFRSGGLNQTEGLDSTGGPSVPREYAEELANGYELGFKGSLGTDARVDWALNFYRVEYNNFLDAFTVVEDDPDGDGTTFATSVAGIGDAYAQGVELDLRGRVSDPFSLGGGLSWSGGVAFAESRITKSDFDPAIEGTQLNQTNTWTWNGNFTYRRPMPFLENTGLGLFAGTNFKWLVDTDSSTTRERDDRKNWNLRFGVEGENHGHDWQLTAFWDNWLDVDYQRNRPGTGTATAPYRYRPDLQPTNFGLRLTIAGGDR
ncbi:MAG: TonB-dependent receptor [Alphaproteobacteria bacterium]|nr:TonB-dependent receptor [Alphaproteobacteria bacterium]